MTDELRNTSILEQARIEAYRDGFGQGMMVAECDCPDCPPAPSRLTWWLIGTVCGSLLSWWFA
jgi:hypothetical protein